MIDLGKGVISGVVATALLCGILLLLSFVGAVPSPEPVRALRGISLFPAALGWVIQFALGAFGWGLLFALVSPALPGLYWIRGLVFGVAICLVMLGAAWLKPTAGLQVRVVPLVLQLLYGAMLGLTYGALLYR